MIAWTSYEFYLPDPLSVWDHIREDKPVSLERLADANGNLMREHRPRRDHGVKFAVLSAGVDTLR